MLAQVLKKLFELTFIMESLDSQEKLGFQVSIFNSICGD